MEEKDEKEPYDLAVVTTNRARAHGHRCRFDAEAKAKLKAEFEGDVAACKREGAKVGTKQMETCTQRRFDERSVQDLEARFLKKQNNLAVAALGYAKYSCRREGFIPGVDGFMDCISAKQDEWWDKHAPAPPVMVVPSVPPPVTDLLPRPPITTVCQPDYIGGFTCRQQ